MPLDGSVGYSSNTPYKHHHFDVLFTTHLQIVQAILRRQSWAHQTYLYIDLNAGKGQYAAEDSTIVLGSPLRAALLAQGRRLRMLQILCERDETSALSLKETLRAHNLHQADWLRSAVCKGDHAAWVPLLLKEYYKNAPALARKTYGLIYSDENGALPPFALLAQLATQLPLVDILIHVAATPIKRQYYSPVHPLLTRLDEFMAQVAKEYWLVREPYGQHQWTFLIGTNWNAFPAFHKQGFWHANTREGSNILRRLSYNRKDYDAQGDLFRG